MPRPAPIVAALRRHRERQHITHTQVADHIGVTPRAVKSWEYGERSPAAEQIEAYATAVGATLDLIVDIASLPTDVDEVLVERACAGAAQWRDLNQAERLAAWQKMRRRGWSRTALGRHFRLSGSTIQTYEAGRAPRPRRRAA